MKKSLIFDAAAREEVLRGATLLANAVRVTLGPKSRCILIVSAGAAHGPWVHLVEAGIVDPTKVVRLALENAVSLASVLLLTEPTLAEVPEPKPEMAAPEA